MLLVYLQIVTFLFLLTDVTFDNLFQHPFGSLAQLLQEDRTSYDKQLLLWYFESCLKKTYNQFIGGLCTMLRDSIEATKRKALKIMYELLASNPEQEQVRSCKTFLNI